eukprot:COSAG02_NODE_44557_length_365_cov_0.721805_1_plen_23_part_10
MVRATYWLVCANPWVHGYPLSAA